MPMPYEEYQSKYKDVCQKVIGKTRDGPFGSHLNRKTAYLLAVWGGGADIDMFASARHKTVSNAAKYKRDAQFLLTMAEKNGLTSTTTEPETKRGNNDH
jgi:hypothetical protein